MKIHAYKVVEPDDVTLAERIKKIAELPVKDRNRRIENCFVRLEAAQEVNGLWLCDFINTRMDHGPAKGNLKKAVEGFDLDAEEGFSEETAILYAPGLKAVVAQYNHHGPRMAAVADYLSIFDHDHPTRYQFHPVYQEDIVRILRRKNIFSKVELTVAPKLLSQADFNAGVGLKEAVDISKATGAEKVTFVLSVHGRKKGLHQVKDLLHWALHKITSQDADAVPACRITAKDDELTPAEILDLVAQRLVAEIDIKSGADKRYPRDERWDALGRTLNRWQQKLR